MPLGIVHIPKSSGMTLAKFLNENVGKFLGSPDRYFVSYSVRRYNSQLLKTKIREIPERSRQDKFWSYEDMKQNANRDCVLMGHITLSEFAVAGFNRVISIIREPRIRFISLYFYWNQLARTDVKVNSQQETNWLKLASGSFDEFLQYSLGTRRGLNLKPKRHFEGPHIFLNGVERFLDSGNQVNTYWVHELDKMVHDEFGLDKIIDESINFTVEPKEKTAFKREWFSKLTDWASNDLSTIETLMTRGVLNYRSRRDLDNELNLYINKKFNCT